MVKLDLTIFKYLTPEDFRVLIAIELGMRNHEYVPVELIETLAKIKRANTHKILKNLLKNKLVEHQSKNYDGYRLNYLGYDFLAIRVLLKKGFLVKILSRMGVGKESDVYFCLVNPKGFVSSDKKELNDEEIMQAQQKLIGDDFDKWEKDEEEELDEDSEDEDEIEECVEDKVDEVENSQEKSNEENENIINQESEVKKEKDYITSNYYENYNQLQDIYKYTTESNNDLNKSHINFHIEKGGELISGILKIARLGRTSFRAVKSKRDFVKNKTHYNWMYLSRLSAQTEFKFLNGLYEYKFPVPKPYGWNRHTILMEYIPSFQLSKVIQIKNPEKIFNFLKAIIYKLAEVGLVHGDLNEFNILISKDENVHIIDFTQMISIDHEKAETYLIRDLKGIRDYFNKKFCLKFTNEDNLSLKELKERRTDFLDIKLDAFGSIKKMQDRVDLEEIESNEEKLNVEKKEELKIDELNEVDENINYLNNDDGFLELNQLNEIEKNNTTGTIKISQHEIKKKVMKIVSKQNKQQIKTKYKKNNKGNNKNKIDDLDF